jgi:hypothetical protein
MAIEMLCLRGKFVVVYFMASANVLKKMHRKSFHLVEENKLPSLPAVGVSGGFEASSQATRIHRTYFSFELIEIQSIDTKSTKNLKKSGENLSRLFIPI